MNTKFLLTILALLISAGAFSQSVGINSDGSTPDKSAILDISSVNQGLLIPRVTLTGVNDAATIASPATSLMVYNLTTGSGLTTGIYYNTGTTVAPVWTRLSDTAIQGLTPTTKAATLATAVPYTGATGAVNLGAYDLTVNGLIVGLGTGAVASNTAIGNSSLRANTKGNSNTALGKNSLYNNTTGSLNTAVGDSALITNTTGNRNTVLGYDADVATSGLTNATAVGYKATVAASNTIQLGNSSVTLVQTSGSIKTGVVTYPNTDGARGQVLTANANGLPTWQTEVEITNLSTGTTGILPVLSGGTGVTTSTGTGSNVLSNSPTLVTPNLGTPSALVGTNITGTASGLTAGKVTTNANLTGDVTSLGNATTLTTTGVTANKYGSATSVPVITVDAKGRVTAVTTAAISSGSGSPIGSALTSGNILVGSSTNVAAAVVPTGDVTISNTGVTAIGAGKVTNAQLAGSIDLTSKVTGILPVLKGGTGTTTSTGTGNVVLSTSPTLVTPLLGTPTSGVATNLTGLPLTTGVTGTLPIANGGTGAITKTAAFNALSPMTASGDIVYGGTSGAGTALPKGADGQVLTLASGVPTWAAAPSGGGAAAAGTLTGATLASNVLSSSLTSVGTLANLTVTNDINGSVTGNAATATTATSAINIAGGASGSIPYQTASGATSLLSKGNNGEVLTLASGVPTWAATSGGGGSGVPYTGATGAVDLGAYNLTVNGITIGSKSNMLAQSSIMLGKGAVVGRVDGATAIGYNASATKDGSIAIGSSASANDDNATAIGYNASAGYESIAIGSSASANQTAGMAIGYGTIGGSYSMAIGMSAHIGSGGNYSTSIGYDSNADNSYSMALGNGASATGDNSTALGNGASVSAANSIQLGNTDVTNVATSGTLTAGAVTYPNAHNSSAGQVLTINGSGVASWAAASSGGGAAATGTLTGTELASNVVSSSLTSVGVLTNATVQGKVVVGAATEASSSAVLEATSTTQGFLPPRMSYDNKIAILVPAQGLMIYCTDCGAKGEPEYYNGTEWVNMVGSPAAAQSLKIGSSYQGGIIAYIYLPADGGYVNGEIHGIIAAPVDQSTGVMLSDGDSPSGAPGFAMAIAAAYRGGDYTDWGVPNKDQLNKLYLNKTAIGGFSTNGYWTTTISGDGYAWYQSFLDGSQNDTSNNTLLSVRAVRTF